MKIELKSGRSLSAKSSCLVRMGIGVDMHAYRARHTWIEFLNHAAVMRDVGICTLYPVQPTSV